MFGTLRFRLTALFLAVVLVFGLVSIALAVRLFQDVTRSQSVRELEREAAGLAQLYAESALRSTDEGTKAPEFAAENLELATGDELYYVGASLFPGQRFGLTQLGRTALGNVELDRDKLGGDRRGCWARCDGSGAGGVACGGMTCEPEASPR